MHPSEIANILRGMDDSDINNAIKIIPKELVGDVALALPDRYFDHIVESLSVDELSQAISELESDDQFEFMQELENVDEEVASKVFEILHEDDKKRDRATTTI
jgi:magnesium transporter